MTYDAPPAKPDAESAERQRHPAPVPGRHGLSPAASGSVPTEQPTGPPLAPSAPRLIGVDLARGLAVLGMFSAHVGPAVTVGGPVGFVLELARGRSSALFALLAGFSLIIITGRPSPRTGRAGHQAVARVVIRALVLMALGYALTALNTQVDVILSFYGLLFLIILPLYRMRATALALIAASGALVLPQVLYAVRQSIDEGTWSDAVIAVDPLARLTDTDGIVELLFTGEYPILTWAPFLIAGMAVARLDLNRPRIRARLAAAGAALAALGYGASWLALHLVPHAFTTISAATDGSSATAAWWSDTVGAPDESTPLVWLLAAAPHSQTTFSVLGNTGVALAVLAACLTAADRLPHAMRLARPVSAVGMTALTAYVLHIVALWLLVGVLHVTAIEDETMSGLPVLLGFVAATLLVATVWTHHFRRGPLEYLLHAATRPARLLR